MKKILLPCLLSVLVSCASSDPISRKPTEADKKYPVVSIETSGDLYYEDGGHNVQMDFFGNCSPGHSMIYVEVDKKKAAADCKKGRYRYSMNLPKSFFQQKKQARTPSSKYVMKEISAYHDGEKKLSATSYILIDRKRKEVKSVINKQVKFEKIPTGNYEPITQYNAFGSCQPGSVMKIDVTSPNRFGHQISKYDEVKECQDSGGFYFLSQVHGYPVNGTVFKIFEDRPVRDKRAPASKDEIRYENLFNWNLPVN